ncbi:MAG TPA: hypothetical protein VLW06_01820, partial [Terriglobales bacterium]|nr:hypothetical protein [Terriglobales bacterium]
VADYGAFIGCKPHIKFKSIAAMLKRQIEGRDCVFTNAAAASAHTSMTQKEWTRSHGELFYAMISRESAWPGF